jgi:hypothetical protein
MKCFSVPNRIKWMKLCSIVWGLAGEGSGRFCFEQDHEGVGEDLDDLLEKLNVQRVNGFLKMFDKGIVNENLSKHVVKEGNRIKMFGFEFYRDGNGEVLRVKA